MTNNETRKRIAKYLDEIAFRNGALQTAKDDLDNAVRWALDEGATWEAIGGTLGISRQAAQQRFS